MASQRNLAPWLCSKQGAKIKARALRSLINQATLTVQKNVPLELSMSMQSNTVLHNDIAITVCHLLIDYKHFVNPMSPFLQLWKQESIVSYADQNTETWGKMSFFQHLTT